MTQVYGAEDVFLLKTAREKAAQFEAARTGPSADLHGEDPPFALPRRDASQRADGVHRHGARPPAVHRRRLDPRPLRRHADHARPRTHACRVRDRRRGGRETVGCSEEPGARGRCRGRRWTRAAPRRRHWRRSRSPRRRRRPLAAQQRRLPGDAPEPEPRADDRAGALGPRLQPRRRPAPRAALLAARHRACRPAPGRGRDGDRRAQRGRVAQARLVARHARAAGRHRPAARRAGAARPRPRPERLRAARLPAERASRSAPWAAGASPDGSAPRPSRSSSG